MDNDIANLRFIYFSVGLCLFAALEAIFPRRERSLPRSTRWFENFTLIGFGWLIAKFTIGFAPIATAAWVYQNKFGLLGLLDLSPVAAAVLSYILLDLTIYTQHIIFHNTPILWRIHRVHHTDLDLDVSSGFRFHPIEIFLSLIIKVFAIAAIGANPLGVLAFEIILNMGSLFNHANINIKGRVDRILRLLLVTPDMHRIHHSIEVDETNSNYGFTISAWDRIFRTYRDSPRLSQQSLELGIESLRSHKQITLISLLALPFKR